MASEVARRLSLRKSFVRKHAGFWHVSRAGPNLGELNYLISFFLLTLFSCQEEVVNIETPKGVGIYTSHNVEVPDVYDSFGKAYRDFYFTNKNLGAEAFNNEYPLTEVPEFNLQNSLEHIEYLKMLGSVSAMDVDLTKSLISYLSQLFLTGDMLLSTIRGTLLEWADVNNVSVKETPVTFHIIKLVNASLFSTDWFMSALLLR